VVLGSRTALGTSTAIGSAVRSLLAYCELISGWSRAISLPLRLGANAIAAHTALVLFCIGTRSMSVDLLSALRLSVSE
jgi:F0F1-type ATP synthase membrane subunit a